MADTTTKLPIRKEGSTPTRTDQAGWRPFEALRHEVDRLFDDFYRTDWMRPLRAAPAALPSVLSRTFDWSTPAVDIVEREKAFEITAELPGLDEKSIEVVLRNGNIAIKGEKQDEKEEKSGDYYLRERQFGAFERTFALPDGVEADKIEARFNKGVLTVTLPKTAEAQKPEQKITVKAA
ncbi:Hsp20/alpha crystallin family protein [uncultured Devosia sp.]|uniref:Hsp20/alpha crystallin family protein n=1 Tax=uncultured Devosia sp. TaxID=211434 RepID=UPI00260DF261|nr:Hsp20/alpha crystallin family protein [uncultured Devosia sp.]